MLSFAQALTITRRCIRAVSGAKNIKQEDSLDRAGITDDDRLDLLKRNICGSHSIGVPSKGHTLAIEELDDIDSDTLVGDLAQIISDKAEGGEE